MKNTTTTFLGGARGVRARKGGPGIKGALAAILFTATALAMGCHPRNPAPRDPDQESRPETKVVEIDERSAAHATRISDTHVRVSIERTDGTLQFIADFRITKDRKTLVEYQIHPAVDDENMSPQPVSAALELETDQLPSLDGAITGAVFIHSQASRAESDEYDRWGCDLLPGKFNFIVSCGPKGACCDVHDACYAKHGCSAKSWKKPPWNKCQLRCNAPAVVCFTSLFPGPSACCARRNCGKPR